jgi:hypothetical protein
MICPTRQPSAFLEENMFWYRTKTKENHIEEYTDKKLTVLLKGIVFLEYKMEY